MMTKVFIGGSRRISRLPDAVQVRLDRIIEQRFPIIVGDANGADKAVQTYLHGKGYSEVEVFCSGSECRNNQGQWPVRTIVTGDAAHGSFEFYSVKDCVMADEASVGLMIWDGKSKGTVMNVLRLLEGGKNVAVYISPEKRFVDLKSLADWEQLLSQADGRTIVRRGAAERPSQKHHLMGKAQPALF